MSQPNRKYKRLEALLSESKPVEPNPVSQPANGEADVLKTRISELEEKLAQQQIPNVIETPVKKSNKTHAPVTTKKRGFLSAPLFENEEENRNSYLLNFITIAYFIVYTSVSLIGLTRSTDLQRSLFHDIPQTMLPFVATLIVAQVILRSGRVKLATFIFGIMLWLSQTYTIYITGGAASYSLFNYVLAIMAFGLLLGRRYSISTAIASVVAAIVFFIMGSRGLLPESSIAGNDIAGIGFFTFFTTAFLSTSLLYLYLRQLDESVQKLQYANQALEESGMFLERRVADRTHDLELASEVGRTIAEKVENTSAMLTEAMEMIRARFNLYYTQIYLLDPSGQTITLRAGTGEAGRQLLQRGHRLLVSSNSLNGRAVSEKKPVIVADTEMSGTFLPNPLLPHTRSEMAIPLLIGDKALGVLDMQSEIPNALNEDNIAAFQVLAGQLSVAIQNATLFAQSEEARKQVEENARQVSKAGWMDFLNGTDRGEKIGYVFDQTDVKPIELKSKPQSNNALSIPITVTGSTVGSIQVAQDERDWTSSETQIIQSTADQLAQHIENLRLLSQAEKYRQEAEQTTRRLTREGWEGYLQTRSTLAAGYFFNPNEVKADDDVTENNSSSTLSRPITVRDEAIGELLINAENVASESVDEIFSAVATQLSSHIENLRLLEETETSRVDVQKSQEQYKLAIAGSNDGLWDWDIAHEQIYYSPRWKEMLGYEEHELTRGFQDWEDLIHPDDHDYATKSLDDYLEQRAEAYDVEIRLRHKDGSWVWIRDRGKALRREDGTPYRMAGAHTDITQRKLDEELIAQRANQLETVAAVSTTASNVLNPDELLQQVVDLTKVRFNLYHAHIYLLDGNWNTLLLAAGAGEVGSQMVTAGHAIGLDTERSLVARAAREKQAVIVNNVRNEAGFLPNPLLPETRSEMALPMIVGDKVLGVFDVQSEIVNSFSREDSNIYTALASQVAVALQNARLYVEQAATVTQLRELDRLKSSFLANMSHELRTPLNSILGFADVILEELDGPLTENMTNDLGLIQKNGQHLLHLINDVLDMAKIESGKMNLNVEKFILHDVIDEVTSITSPLASEKSLALFIEPDSDHDVEINADKIRLRQVMINIVNNAMKFTEKGRISIRALRDGNNVLISVNDTGIGIPPDHLESVFQEFTQMDTTTTRKTGGTGLGLPISRRLINMHSGRLWAESTGVNGEGATFHVQLPIEANINENASLTAN